MQKVIFFDRDGTLIINKDYLNDYKQIEYLPKAFETLKELRDHGYKFIVVTNQSGMPRGLVSPEQLKAIHQQIIQDFAKHGVEFLNFYHSPHLPISNHPLRKPNPGMLLEADRDYNIDFKKSWMIGDRMSDVEAGHRAGCKSILIGDVDPPENSNFAAPEAQVTELYEINSIIVSNSYI